jgi:hypothetical protein
MKKILVLLVAVLSCSISAEAQSSIKISGIVKDASTKEAIPLVAVRFENSSQGTSTDDKGTFTLENTNGHTRLIISSMGYREKIIETKSFKTTGLLEIMLEPATYELAEIEVKARRGRYSRKNNPAVELIKKVIEHKDRNRMEAKEEYGVELYEKLTFSLEDFNPEDFGKNSFSEKVRFIKEYQDTSEFNGKPILTLSIRESLSDLYYRKIPQSRKVVVKGKQVQGIDKTIDEGGISANLEEVFQSVNIFDNDINILLNRFVSPLSSVLAVSYYHYFIMDTTCLAGDSCVNLAFTPVSGESYGFTGNLYVTLDGKYSVRKFVLHSPSTINLNFVDKMSLSQEFIWVQDSTLAVSEENIYVDFSISKNTHKILAHKKRTYDNYRFRIENSDSIFGFAGEVHVMPMASLQPDSFWVNSRHVPLREKEQQMNDLLLRLQNIPIIRTGKKAIEIIGTDYVRTGKIRELSKFDFGPVNTVFTSNYIEGARFRVGGMTTANFHPHWFGSGYIAYGTRDRKLKYNAKLTYSFNGKSYFESEYPVNRLSILHEYDVYTPGQDFLFTSKDNIVLILRAGERVRKMTYIRKTGLEYEKDWLNGFSVRAWATNQQQTAAGDLQFVLKTPDGLLPQNRLTSSEIGLQFRFAPGERIYGGRTGRDSPLNLSKDAPVFKLSHQIGLKGVFGGEYHYHRTELSAQKRIWLSSFGHIDAQAKGGKVWSKVPFPLLILPNTNQSLIIQPESFHLMRQLEFVADRYVSLNVTYYMKGLIFNRIPGIKRLGLREVVSFNGIYGKLSNKNNPDYDNNLFLFPQGTAGIGNTPYMETSFGLENLFKIIRIDYYRRLSCLENPGIQKGGFRVGVRFTF